MRTVSRALCALALTATTSLLVACGSSAPPAASPPAHAEPPGEAGLETWERNHPEASRELGDWVKAHPEAAHLFFDWDGHHPHKSKEFVAWTLAHPGDDIDVFVLSHPKWEYFDKINETHRPAAQSFMAWCRHHPKAAEALMHHERGLEWAGHHLYKAYWSMETK
jgi:hypothetical protein